ncbi:hypothetical protein L7F22_039706 [Adiantum nelumboides]|nr:hypothetical protein [Adiantum nelumboides]
MRTIQLQMMILETSDSVEVQFDDAVQAIDGTSDVYDVPCRVSLPTHRRGWATSQDEKAVRFRMDMPGIAKEDVKIYVDNGKLVVRGKYVEKRILAELEENVDDEASVLADNVGSYSAELFLPENVQADRQNKVADERWYAFGYCSEECYQCSCGVAE